MNAKWMSTWNYVFENIDIMGSVVNMALLHYFDKFLQFKLGGLKCTTILDV